MMTTVTMIVLYLGVPGGSDGKESACNVGDLGSIPGSGRSPGPLHRLFPALHHQRAEDTIQMPRELTHFHVTTMGSLRV